MTRMLQKWWLVKGWNALHHHVQHGSHECKEAIRKQGGHRKTTLKERRDTKQGFFTCSSLSTRGQGSHSWLLSMQALPEPVQQREGASQQRSLGWSSILIVHSRLRTKPGGGGPFAANQRPAFPLPLCSTGWSTFRTQCCAVDKWDLRRHTRCSSVVTKFST